jgi:hypothetical protein
MRGALFSITHNKIVPIYQFCKSLLGRRRGQRHNTPPFCEMWIGISADENPKRCKPAQEAWIVNRYPLRELGMTRADCATWLWKNYHVVVPKSACIGCLIWKRARSACSARSIRRHLGPIRTPGCVLVWSCGDDSAQVERELTDCDALMRRRVEVALELRRRAG